MSLVASHPEDSWRNAGMKDTGTRAVQFSGATATPVGSPGEYLQRAGLWTGCRSGAPGAGRSGRKCRTPRPCARCSHRSRPWDRWTASRFRAPWLDPGGDGWTAARRGRVVALVGSNLMKFAPLLGDRLAQAALSDELPSDLTP